MKHHLLAGADPLRDERTVYGALSAAQGGLPTTADHYRPGTAQRWGCHHDSVGRCASPTISSPRHSGVYAQTWLSSCRAGKRQWPALWTAATKIRSPHQCGHTGHYNHIRQNLRGQLPRRDPVPANTAAVISPVLRHFIQHLWRHLFLQPHKVPIPARKQLQYWAGARGHAPKTKRLFDHRLALFRSTMHCRHNAIPIQTPLQHGCCSGKRHTAGVEIDPPGVSPRIGSFTFPHVDAGCPG